MIPQFKLIERSKILYAGAGGGSNATEITLTDSINNYNEYEVYYSLNAVNGAVKSVRAKRGEPVSLDGSLTGYFNNEYYAIRVIATSAYIEGNTLHKAIGYVQDLIVNGTMRFSDQLNGIYVKRVIEYKN